MAEIGTAENNDSLKIDKQKVYSFLLDGRINDAIVYVNCIDSEKLLEKDLDLKNKIIEKFGGEKDNSIFINSNNVGLDEILIIFRNYWRKSFIIGNEFDDELISELYEFLNKNLIIPKTTFEKKDQDSLNHYLKEFVKSQGFITTGFGRTGSYLDFLCWETEEDTIYTFEIHNEILAPKVIRMKNFLSLGWQEYATFNTFYPGGWATKEAIYYVDSAFKTDSENFLVGYLAHEGQHLRDYKFYPKLTGADLEYRAKLTELSMYQDYIYNFLQFTISNSNYESKNAHSIANYCVVRDMSRKLFEKDFENDIEKWKEISVVKLNETAEELFRENTESLDKIGSEVQNYIKQ
ncbi:MAG TPA: hypothetical protein PLG90_01635 [Ignavibacteria bacterium]|nr:hypothetical protein [Ignavibacteria bacterium]